MWANLRTHWNGTMVSVRSTGVEGGWMFLAHKNIDSTDPENNLGAGAVDDWELRAFVLAVVRFDAYHFNYSVCSLRGYIEILSKIVYNIFVRRERV